MRDFYVFLDHRPQLGNILATRPISTMLFKQMRTSTRGCLFTVLGTTSRAVPRAMMVHDSRRHAGADEQLLIHSWVERSHE